MDHCDNCGKEVKEHELQEVINYDADEIQHICKNCLAFYAKCDLCGMYRPNDLVEFEPETKRNICNFCHEMSNEESPIPIQDIDMEEESWQD